MTASAPKSDLNQLWIEHQSNVRAVAEVSVRADEEMRAMISTLKAYRLHKKRCSTETEVDMGILAELILELEMALQC